MIPRLRARTGGYCGEGDDSVYAMSSESADTAHGSADVVEPCYYGVGRWDR